MDARWAQKAQHDAAQVIRSRAGRGDGDTAPKQYHSIDVSAVDVVRPRSVAVEHVAVSALRQVGLDEQLTMLGFNGPQRAAAIGSLIGRMTAPGSELATHHWLQQRSALGKLIDFDFTTLDVMALYRISDRLLAHKPALEAFLYERERDLFDLDEVIRLYDLTNTYFEGTAHANAKAAFGKSKEKRTDCPLVTLALVLDASGFPKRSRVFAGNAAEAQRLVNDDTGEVELYCHSTQREQKERGIAERFAQRLEAEWQKLADGLHSPASIACAPIRPNGTSTRSGRPMSCSPTWRRCSAH